MMGRMSDAHLSLLHAVASPRQGPSCVPVLWFPARKTREYLNCQIAEILQDQQIHTEDLKSAESVSFQLRWLVHRAFQLFPFSSLSGSHRPSEIFIISHGARWACRGGVHPSLMKTSAGQAPALSLHTNCVVPAEEVRSPWPHLPGPLMISPSPRPNPIQLQPSYC